MKFALVVALALCACHLLKSAPDEDSSWSGINSVDANCAWGDSNNTYSHPGTCIAHGQSYACIWDKKRDEVQCAKTSAPTFSAPRAERD